MGSGDIAVPALAALASCTSIALLGVATQPDRPQGRKRIMTSTPVAQWAAETKVSLHRPASVNHPDFLNLLSTLHLDLIVVFAFGQILKDELLRLPRLGSVNVHASLLPKYRGAAPVTAAILNGDRQTGVSIMQMNAQLDAGAVYARYPIELTGQETAPELERRLGLLAAEKICPCLAQIARGEVSPHPQDDRKATYAPKVRKEDGQIDWSKPAAAIERHVRAYLPWPGARFTVPTRKRDLHITLTAATVLEGRQGPPGSWLQADENGWIAACGQDALRLDRVIPEGRKEMSGIEFLRGRPLLQQG